MSGGHYPSYNHLQSSQEFLGSRHRLPRIPPPGPPTVSLPHAHSSNTSWMNKQSKSYSFFFFSIKDCKIKLFTKTKYFV